MISKSYAGVDASANGRAAFVSSSVKRTPAALETLDSEEEVVPAGVGMGGAVTPVGLGGQAAVRKTAVKILDVQLITKDSFRLKLKKFCRIFEIIS